MLTGRASLKGTPMEADSLKITTRADSDAAQAQPAEMSRHLSQLRAESLIRLLREYQSLLITPLRKGARIAPRGASSPKSLGVVGAVQDALSFLGYNCPLDGNFQDETEAAVQSFQRDAYLRHFSGDALSPSGEVDAATFAALLKGLEMGLEAIKRASGEQGGGDAEKGDLPPVLSDDEARKILTPDKAGDLPRAVSLGHTKGGVSFRIPGLESASIQGKLKEVLPFAEMRRLVGAVQPDPVQVQKASWLSIIAANWATILPLIVGVAAWASGVMKSNPATIWGFLGLSAIGLLAGAWLFNESKKRAFELTKLLARNRADRDQNDIVLVSGQPPKPEETE